MRTRFLMAIGVLATLSVISVPAQQPGAATAGQGLPAGVLPGTKLSAFTTIQGSALSATGAALAYRDLRLRDARVGRLVRSLRTDEYGLFAFRIVDPGSYIVELLDREDKAVLAASPLLHLNAGEVGSAVVREPMPLESIELFVGFADARASAVTSVAGANGILSTQVTGDDVSPR
jgi:hypothetical protein